MAVPEFRNSDDENAWLRDLVRALASIEDPTVEDRDYMPAANCGLCGASDPEYKHLIADPAEHEPTCPWRMAREWAALGDCETCDGSGVVVVGYAPDDEGTAICEPCDNCGGTGTR